MRKGKIKGKKKENMEKKGRNRRRKIYRGYGERINLEFSRSLETVVYLASAMLFILVIIHHLYLPSGYDVLIRQGPG